MSAKLRKVNKLTQHIEPLCPCPHIKNPECPNTAEAVHIHQKDFSFRWVRPDPAFRVVRSAPDDLPHPCLAVAPGSKRLVGRSVASWVMVVTYCLYQTAPEKYNVSFFGLINSKVLYFVVKYMNWFCQLNCEINFQKYKHCELILAKYKIFLTPGYSQITLLNNISNVHAIHHVKWRPP